MHLARKIRKTGRRMLKTSRVAGRTLGKGTGFARKLIGTADKYTAGGASRMLNSNPYSAAAYKGLVATDIAAKMAANPQASLKKQLIKGAKDLSGVSGII